MGSDGASQDMPPTLETIRLILRPLSFADRNSLVDTIMSDQDVMYWLPGSDETTTIEGQRAVASAYLTKRKTAADGSTSSGRI